MSKQTFALQFYPSESFLNFINPLAKFCLLISLSLILFISQSIKLHTGIFAFCALLFLFSPISFYELQGAKAVILTTIFIGLLQVIFTHAGRLVLELGIIQVTDLGLQKAISASAKFISILLLGYLFVLTTEPESFVLSLVGIGLSYRFGYALIIALQMIPLVRAEIKKISFAQFSRGVSYYPFPLKNLITNVRSFLKVVLISTIKRVNQLVISMEGRSFGLYPIRTTLSLTRYRWSDYLLIILSIILIPISILWR